MVDLAAGRRPARVDSTYPGGADDPVGLKPAVGQDRPCRQRLSVHDTGYQGPALAVLPLFLVSVMVMVHILAFLIVAARKKRSTCVRRRARSPSA